MREPQHLLQFAHMGAIFSPEILAIASSRGAAAVDRRRAREGKPARREKRPLLAASDVRFIGNEGSRDLLNRGADVVVCDGFTGNMALK